MLKRFILEPARRIFRFFASLKTAIPLIVVTVVVTIAGSLLPTPDFFRTWWYLGLLALNGVSLLFITIVHTPMILARKGRNALIGVVVTHAGILVLIVGIIYGGLSGFRHEVRVIEGQVTVVPGLPFAVELERLDVEEYPPEAVAHLAPGNVPLKRQDSHLVLYRDGEKWRSAVAAPGKPMKVDGITILPSFKDIGWYFELKTLGPGGDDRYISVRPWSPPVFKVGRTQVMAHSMMDADGLAVQVLTIEDGEMKPLGFVREDQPLDINGWPLSLADHRRYTSLAIYDRPHAPVLVIGCLAMLFGLVWHFYFRHRDRKPRSKELTDDV